MKTLAEIDWLRNAAVDSIMHSPRPFGSLCTIEEAENALLHVGADASTAMSLRRSVYHGVNRKLAPHIKTRKALSDAVEASRRG